MLLANLDVFSHLGTLDVPTHFVLEGYDLGFEKPHFFHQVFVELILVNFAAFFREQLHFLLDEREDKDLLILIQHTITALIKDINKVLSFTQPKHIVNVLSALFENKTDVRLVEKTLFAEISLLDGCPDLLALAGTTDKRPGLLNELLDLVARYVCQACVGLSTDATDHLSSLNCAAAN